MPLITQSDLGSENYNIAYAHTAVRQTMDPKLAGTIQHRWKRKSKNVKPENLWSQLHQRRTPGYEDLLDQGIHGGIFNTANHLEV